MTKKRDQPETQDKDEAQWWPSVLVTNRSEHAGKVLRSDDCGAETVVLTREQADAFSRMDRCPICTWRKRRPHGHNPTGRPLGAG
jgi:hypothetical protein